MTPSTAERERAALIGPRLDRLPATRSVWTYIILLSLGGFFEYYDLFFTGYVAPGLVKSRILTTTTRGLFGSGGIASFVAAMFSGLFLGTLVLSFAADRFGRRKIFTFSLLWYSAATLVMAFQSGALGLNLWRFIAGIGVGVQLVTIDSYLSELAPKAERGRAFAVNHVIQFCAVPIVALLAWLLVPTSPLGLDGWRWLVLIGAGGAIVVWFIQRQVPESPRWLVQHGRVTEAERILAALEIKVMQESGAPLPPVGPPEPSETGGRLREVWRPPYLTRTIMLVIFNLFQTVGFYGFSNWVPTLLIARGIHVTTSLEYTFIIAIAAPFGPLLGAAIADRIERKWLIVVTAAGIAIFGLLFGQSSTAFSLIALGVLLTLSANTLSVAFHAYQAELYPTRIRARAVGLVYSWSRLSVVLFAYVISFFLDRFGVPGVFALIAGSMVVVILTVAIVGPRSNNLALERLSE